VVLIIGILIAGISQGIGLYNDTKISNARSLTRGAPIPRIANLELWLETSLTESFLRNETTNNTPVTSWLDINPSSTFKKNAQVINSENSTPRYIANGINNLPSLEFGYNSTFHKLSIPNLSAGNNASFVFVIQPHTNNVQGLFSSSELAYVFRNNCDASCTNGAFSLWNNTNNSSIAQVDINLTPFKDYIVYVEIFNNGTNRGLRIFVNGALVGSDTENAVNNVSWQNPYIGTIHYNYAPFRRPFNGKLGEFIVYSRTLSDKERQSIEEYLKNKWSIK